MKPNEIKGNLLIKNTRQMDIARRLGISAATVHNVISGRCRSARVEAEIAHILGKSVSKIWPGRAASA